MMQMLHTVVILTTEPKGKVSYLQ